MPRTFVIRARRTSTKSGFRNQIGTSKHFEVIAHSVINAFFIANGFRENIEVYIIFDSTDTFPCTLKLSSNEGLSLAGFHENAVIELMEHAFKDLPKLQKNATAHIAPGVEIQGIGFEKLIASLAEDRSLYILAPKGQNIRTIALQPNPVFILTDHLAMPKKTLLGLKRYNIATISLGKQMLFASQCVVIINHEMDLSDL